MIARLWHGRTRASRADHYSGFIQARVLPEYSFSNGNLGAHIMRRTVGNEAHFLALSFWESEAAIRRFVGDDAERAKYYLEDRHYLLELEPDAVHYEMVGESLRKGSGS